MKYDLELDNVLSLFDGMSCGQLALDTLGIKVNNYFASEIDPYAMKIAKKNYPNTKHIGSVVDVKGADLPKIDLLIGGSPCQSFSNAGDRTGMDGKSKLFWEFVRVLKETNPTYFLLENVRMKKEWENIITEQLGVKPILINSRLVSAQNRPRLYWTNIPDIGQPLDRCLVLADILEEQVDDKFNLSDQACDYMSRLRNGKPRWEYHTNPLNGKSACLTANMYKGVPYGVIKEKLRRLTPVECERLQTVPDNYTVGVSDTQRFKMLGNGWTIDIIAHLLNNMRYHTPTATTKQLELI
jgi:DNA-cytosine methyltransferase